MKSVIRNADNFSTCTFHGCKGNSRMRQQHGTGEWEKVKKRTFECLLVIVFNSWSGIFVNDIIPVWENKAFINKVTIILHKS